MVVVANVKHLANRLARLHVELQINNVRTRTLAQSKSVHCYKLNGYNIVIDIASGSVHNVDDVAFDAISLYKRFDDKNELVSLLIETHPDIDKNEVLALFDDIELLVSRGKLFSPDNFASVFDRNNQADATSAGDRLLPLQNDSVPLKALCLNVAHACNMVCNYCFADYATNGGNIGHGTIPCHGQNSDDDAGQNITPRLMNLDVGKRAIDYLLEHSDNIKTLDVDFFGGEPLLNWDIVKAIVLYARELEQNSDKKFRFTLTTNGLLIDDDVISFTGNHMYNVVLSLDGRPEVHDAMRKLHNGGGSYAEVLPKFKKLVDARHGKGYYIRGTYTNKNLDFLSDILHIADLGFREISLEPVVSSPNSALDLSADNLLILFDQYEALAIEMLRRETGDNGFSFYHFTIDLTGGPCIHKRLAGCGVAGSYLAVTPSGELYPCHQFVGNDNFIMGDVWKGVTNTKLQDEFSSCSIYSRDECRDCWARFYCSGGCVANAYYTDGSINGIYELGCEIFKKRIECAIMMRVARTGA